MRINARLDDEHMEKIEFLKNKRHLSTTDFMKSTIDTLYEESQSKPGGTIQELLCSDFVGGWEGPEDGSTNYKKYVTEYLDEKYPDR